MDINRGDTVKFNARGKNYTGKVNRVFIKTSRKRARLAMELGIRDDASTEMVEIAMENGSIWSVPSRNIKDVKTGSKKDAEEAAKIVRDLKNHNAEIKYKKIKRNSEKIDERNLEGLRAGDEIEVMFKGGYWLKREFRKISASGKVGFVGQYGKNRWAHPENVRIPKKSSQEV